MLGDYPLVAVSYASCCSDRNVVGAVVEAVVLLMEWLVRTYSVRLASIVQYVVVSEINCMHYTCCESSIWVQLKR